MYFQAGLWVVQAFKSQFSEPVVTTDDLLAKKDEEIAFWKAKVEKLEEQILTLQKEKKVESRRSLRKRNLDESMNTEESDSDSDTPYSPPMRKLRASFTTLGRVKLQAEDQIKKFASRGPRGTISDEMIGCVLGLTMNADLSFRQTTSTLETLSKNLPFLGKVPSLKTAQRVVYSLPFWHNKQAVDYLSKSAKLALSFDASSKAGASILAIHLQNDQGDRFLLGSLPTVDQSAAAHAEDVLNVFSATAKDAVKFGFIENEEGWLVNQLSKIELLCTDSANSAIAGRFELAKLIQDRLSQPDKTFMHVDCSMHQVSCPVLFV